MATPDSTTAILHHNLRGSGREVTIRLVSSGIEILSMTGEPIAVWPYPAIAPDRTPGAEMSGLRLEHDDLLVLRIHNGAWLRRAAENSPALAKSLQDTRTDRWLRLWEGVPDSARAAVLIGLIVGLIKLVTEIQEWLFP